MTTIRSKASPPPLRSRFTVLAIVTTALACVPIGTPPALAQTAPQPAQSAPASPAPAKPAPAKSAPAKPAPAKPAAPQPASAQPASAAATATLPRGASVISETYGDWTIECRVVQGRKACTLSQAQGDPNTGRRVFAIEFLPTRDGQTPGTILVPFGVNLEPGIKLKLDETDLGRGAIYSTCISTGCLVPISFPTVATDAMKKSKTLVVIATRPGQTEPVTFSAPLQGFGEALTRMTELWTS
ncbi:invasion associated locus B family protein [Chelatococcus reniformis]|uniref:Invasion protein n=1 Tax=Chelatococcus reniformis TaxID=1494448 RepID=A0A916XFM8_9HYPH|nr:invasion associated locus B family protein [Chelatococcus reniformis]GGC69853.1 hypothetical protein GCM10010994_30510 [Chelatococcus reniformis]